MDAESAIAIVDCNNFYAPCERVVMALDARGDWQGKSTHRGNDSYHMVGRTLGQG